MSAPSRWPIGALAFGSALVVSSLVVSVPARAADCLTAPNSAAPVNSHWYYRTDRTQQRKCWYLRAADHLSQPGAVQTGREATLAKPLPSMPAASPHPRRAGTKLSDKDVEKLYAEFLEWSRHAKNQGKEHQ